MILVSCLCLLTACGKQVKEEVAYDDIAPQKTEPVVLIPENYVEEVEETEESTAVEEKRPAFVDGKQVTYEIEKGVYQENGMDITYPVITQMENTELQNQINQTIYTHVIEQVNQENLSSCQMDYEIASKGSGIFSVIMRGLVYYKDAAYPQNLIMTFNIDMADGKNLRLKDYADLAKVVAYLEQNYGYEMVSDISQADFSAFMNNGYVTDYAITMLDYDFDFSNQQFIPQGYSCIRDDRLVLFITTEHALGDFVEIQFLDEITFS